MGTNRLRDILGEDAVSIDPESLREAAQDWSPISMLRRRRGDAFALPSAVVRPKDASQVSAVLRYAQEARVPVVPRGGGSGVCGAADPRDGAVVLDMRRLDRIEIDRDALRVVAGAGVMGAALEDALARDGLTLGHFPQSIDISTVGGWVATRSAGQKSTRYGRIDDAVMGLEVVLANGSIVRIPTRPATSAGPDLARLFLGSEGTLGVITEIALRASPAAGHSEALTFGFGSFEEGLDAARALVLLDVPPAVLRMHDEPDALIAFRERAPGGAVLILRMEATAGMARPVAAAVRETLEQMGAADLGPDLSERWWAHRNNAVQTLRSVMLDGALGPHALVDTLEVAAPWPCRRLYEGVRAALSKHADLVGCHVSHPTPQGTCLYFTFVVTTAADDNEAERRWQSAWADAMEATIAAGGTITHHHGLGWLRAPWSEQELGDALGLWRMIKNVLDPAGIMNPGKAGL